MGISAKVGDVFAVPLNDASWGVGAVVNKWKSELYLVLFKERFSNVEEVRNTDISILTPCLASSSLDAKIWHGHWPVIKQHDDFSMFSQPAFKVEEPNGTVLESFDRSLRFRIDRMTANKLAFRTGVAPIRLENALKALHGLVPWDPIYSGMDYRLACESAEILKTKL